MATLLKPDGTSVIVRPMRRNFTLEELNRMVGGSIESVPTRTSKRMIVNDECRENGMPRNEAATALLTPQYLAAGNYMCGPAVVLDSAGEA